MDRMEKNFSKVFILFSFFLTLVFFSGKASAVEYREKDKKCMEECHSKDIRYNPFGYYGNLNSIGVDYEGFLKSKHGLFNCVDCHYDVDAGEKTHFVKGPSARCEFCHIDKDKYPENIKKLFVSKGIKMEDKKRVYEDYRESLHGKAFYENKKNAPYCTGCHNPHNADLTSPNSTVSKANLPKTCSKCHPNEGKRGEGLLAKIALLRINGHKKGDSSIDYSAKNCIACHQGDGVHGKKVSELNCKACHKKGASFFFSDFHGKELSTLTYLLNFGLIFGAIIFVGAGIGFMAGKQKEIKKEDESH